MRTEIKLLKRGNRHSQGTRPSEEEASPTFFKRCECGESFAYTPTAHIYYLFWALSESINTNHIVVLFTVFYYKQNHIIILNQSLKLELD